MKLRPYQTRAVGSIGRCLGESGSTLLVMATGLGKTVVFGHAIKQHCRGRALVLAHREELVTQNARTIGTVIGEPCDIERADQHADLNQFHKSRVIVASKDSLHRKRLARFDPSEFGMIVTDESHHAVADSYGRVFDYFKGVPHLGVTATPDRLDEEALGQIYNSVAMVYGIADGIRDGWLVPVRAHTVFVKSLDLSGISTTGGDLNQGELAEQLERERTLHEVAASVTKECGDRRAIVFTVTVRGAEILAQILNDYRPGCARMVCGETPTDERQGLLAAHRANQFQFLCNVGIATEGYDDPGTSMIVMCRPTKSRALFAQCLGRGTRTLPGLVENIATPEGRRAAIAGSGKPDMVCLDFTGNCGRHKLATPADVLGDKFSQEDRDAAADMLEEETGDVMEAMEKAKSKRERETQTPEVLAFQSARERIVAIARYMLRPEDLFDGAFTPGRERSWLGGKPPTDPQIMVLEKKGLLREDIAKMSRSECSRLIGEFIGRQVRGLATIKQVRALERRGYKDAANMTFADASAAMDRLYGART